MELIMLVSSEQHLQRNLTNIFRFSQQSRQQPRPQQQQQQQSDLSVNIDEEEGVPRRRQNLNRPFMRRIGSAGQ